MRLRTRLTLVAAALTALVLAATGVLLSLRLQADLRSILDEELDSRADALVESRDGGEPIEERHRRIEQDEALAQILRRDGTVLHSSAGLLGRLLPETETEELRTPRLFERTVRTTDGEVDVRVLAVPSPGGRIVVVAASVEHHEEAISALQPLLFAGGPVVFVLVTIVVWVMAGAALRPVEKMRLHAEALSAGETGRRLPVPDTRDEIARLGSTINRFLDRIEHAIERERRFVDDASHELRTPLAVLRSEIELALSRARSGAELEAALRSAAEETERLTRTAEDLLVLARADRGRLPIRRTDVDAAELVAQLAEGFAARASERGVSVEVAAADGAVLAADSLRLRQVLSNLLDNAVRHAPDRTAVRVVVASEPDAVSIEVRDSGPGFPAAMLGEAFEPFVRGDAARSREHGGAGLGLAIVKALVDAHGGTVAAENAAEGGAVVRVRLPR